MNNLEENYLYELFVIEVRKAYSDYSDTMAQKLIDDDVSNFKKRFEELIEGIVLDIPSTFNCYINYICSKVGSGHEPKREVSQCYNLLTDPIFSYWRNYPNEWRTHIETAVPIGDVFVPDGLRRELSLGYTPEDNSALSKLAKSCADRAQPVIEAYKAAMLDIIAYPSALPPDHDLDRIATEFPAYLYPQDRKGYYRTRKSLMSCFKVGLFKGISLRILKKYIRKMDGTEYSPSAWEKYPIHDYI